MKQERIDRCHLSLEGLSIGDAFGQQFFLPHVAAEAKPSNPPPPPWKYTDDTEMAVALVETLEASEEVDQDQFARRLAERFEREPYRAYGAGARELLEEVSNGGDWRTLSKDMFGGSGSYGNGAAMRVAPLGAYFADNINETIKQATLSAEVTHTNSEGIIGAIAVALAAGWACRQEAGAAEELIPWVISNIDKSEVRKRLEWVASYPLDTWAFTIASQVGCGDLISAQDTVPFCIWMAAAHMHDYEGGLWTTARVGGDRDTTCAIVGGITSLYVKASGIPKEWRRWRESIRWTSYEVE